MAFLSAVTLIAFFFFGSLGSFHDFKTRRVGNNLIRAALIWSLLSYVSFAFLYFLGYISPGSEIILFYKSALINLGFCGVCALILWYRRLWPSGDAKFFIVLSSLIVLINPNIPGFPYWLCVKLLINTFIPAALLIVFAALIEAIGKSRTVSVVGLRKRLSRYLRQWAGMVTFPSPKWLIIFLWNALVFSALIETLAGKWPNHLGGILPVILYLLFYLSWGRLQRALRSSANSTLLTAVLAIAAVLFHERVIPAFERGGIDMIGFFIFFWIMRLIETRLRLGQLRPVKIRDLGIGDVLSERSWDFLSETCVSSGGEALVRYADGLFQEDLEMIFKYPNLDLDHEAEIYETRPFAFWIFLGALWTLFAVNTFPHDMGVWLGFH